jgi:ankyrin repeat protein
MDIHFKLFEACRDGDIKLVKSLIQSDQIDINYTSFKECDSLWALNPLFTACVYKHRDIVELLLQSGANIEMEIYSDRPINIACTDDDDVKIAELLIAYGADLNETGPLLDACCYCYGHTNVVELLLQHGANVNGLINSKRTPLQIAISVGNTNILKILLRYGAHVNNGHLSYLYSLRPSDFEMQRILKTTMKSDCIVRVIPFFNAVWPSGDSILLQMPSSSAMPPEMIIHIASSLTNYEFSTAELERVQQIAKDLHPGNYRDQLYDILNS